MIQEKTIVVIAGTTESRAVIEQLLQDKEPKKIIATTATALGTQMLKEYGIEVREGKLTEVGFQQLFQEIKPSEVIDASHPFAVIVTKTVQGVCKTMKIPYKRIEREVSQYEYEKLIRVANIEEAIGYLNQEFLEETILLTTGSNTLKQYVEEVVRGQERIYARVLDCEYSRGVCKNVPLDPTHIFYQNPPFSQEDTRRAIVENGCTVMVTKDSGKTGGVDQKIEVAKQLGTFVILIERPREEQEEKGGSK